jgi:hypothetical protein
MILSLGVFMIASSLLFKRFYNGSLDHGTLRQLETPVNKQGKEQVESIKENMLSLAIYFQIPDP